MTGRVLIVNADDLGQSPAINRGVAEAADGGVVTSASLMVRWPHASEAARWAEHLPSFSLGLHVDMGEWAFREGEWRAVYGVVPEGDADAVSDELSRQLGLFLRLVGRPPTHLDSHQNVHRREPLRSLLLAAADRLGVPVRGMSTSVAYCGGFYGQWGNGQPMPEAITFDSLLALLDGLEPGTTELGCHPAAAPVAIDSMYVDERVVELATLCDARLPAALSARGIVTGPFGRTAPSLSGSG